MKFTQYYLDCLSQASYLIGDETTGRAVVVDPRRDVGIYLRDAEAEGLTIELVIETHFHADFVSGHLELAAATGAEIGFSSVASTEFGSRPLGDDERISLGEVELEIRHTPGHTPESLCIVVRENADDEVPYGVLTGDTLFIGDVGRPDLLSSVGFTRAELAGQLYTSLHTRLLTLPDATRVFPGHGAGSACGKNLSADTVSTIGEQRASNYALLAPDEATFVALVTEGLAPAPSYFAHDAVLNRSLREVLDETTPPAKLDLVEFDAMVADGAVIVDARSPKDFALGHFAGSINVGLSGRYAEFAGSVVPTNAAIVLVVDDGLEIEARNRLGRIGFDRVLGYLADPVDVLADNREWAKQGRRLTAREFATLRQATPELQLVDVRNPGEVALGTIDGAVAIPVAQLPDRLAELDPALPTVVFCAGGYRSSVGASVLRGAGFADVSDILGGYASWSELLAPVE